MHIVQNPGLCKMINRLNLELLTYGYATVDRQWYGSVRSPLFTRLYYIVDGTCTFVSPGVKTLQLTAGNWYLIPSGYSFDFECAQSMDHFYFHIKLADFDGTDLLRDALVPLCLSPRQEVDAVFLRRCAESNAPLDGLKLRQFAADMVHTFLEEFQIPIRAENYSPCIYKALTYIKQNLSMGLSITEIAENVFVSKSTLTKHFQKELGMTVNQYICNTIMAKAEYLLIQAIFPSTIWRRNLVFPINCTFPGGLRRYSENRPDNTERKNCFKTKKTPGTGCDLFPVYAIYDTCCRLEWLPPGITVPAPSPLPNDGGRSWGS